MHKYLEPYLGLKAAEAVSAHCEQHGCCVATHNCCCGYAEMMKHGAVSGKVLEVQDLQHLESVVDKAGSSLLVVFFYTRSCGVCKELLRDFTQLCEEVSLFPIM